MGALDLLPSLLGTLLQVTHTVEHLAAELEDRSYPVGTLVHSHDGSTHAHGPAVAMVAAAFEVEGDAAEEDPEAVPPLILMAATSGAPTSEAAPMGQSRAVVPAASHAPRWDPGTPPVPPPRA